MQDVVYVAIIVAFFGLSVLLVRFCDWLIGEPEPRGSDSSSGGVHVS